MREAPAAGSTPNFQRPTPNFQFQATLRGRILSLDVGRWVFNVEMLPRILMRLPCAWETMGFTETPPNGRVADMRKDALGKAIRRTPFQPFVLRLAEGRAVRVPHHDFISMHPTGRTVIVYGPNEDLEILDVMPVTSPQVASKTSRRK